MLAQEVVVAAYSYSDCSTDYSTDGGNGCLGGEDFFFFSDVTGHQLFLRNRKPIKEENRLSV